jgi:HEAT repeat protein
VRLFAVNGRALRAQVAPETLPTHMNTLIPLLDDRDERVCQGAALVLAAIGKPVVPGVLKVLETGSPRARAAALHLLGGVEAEGPEVKAAMEAALDDVSLLVRVSAAGALYGLTGEMGRVVPLIEEASESDDEKVRLTAVTVLFTLTHDEHEDAPLVLSSLLERFLDDPVEEVRVFAAVALESLGALSEKAQQVLDAVRTE